MGKGKQADDACAGTNFLSHALLILAQLPIDTYQLRLR